MRFWGLLGLIVAACAGFTIFWFAQAGAAREKTEDMIAGYQDQGWEIKHAPIEVSGWPYRLNVHVPDLVITPPNATQRIQADIVSAILEPWNWGHVIFVVDDDLVIHDLSTGSETHVKSTRTKASYVGDEAHLKRLALDIIAPEVTREGVQIFTAQRAQLHLREVDGTLNMQDMYVQIKGPQADVTELPLVGTISDFVIDARLKPMPASLHPADLAAWQSRGGMLEVNSLRLHTDTLKLEAEGNLHLDDSGRPAGEMHIMLQSGGLLAAVIAGPDGAQMGFVDELSKTFGFATADSSGLEAEIILRDGRIILDRDGLQINLGQSPQLIETSY